MHPSCPHCEQPDMSLLRVVLIGEVLCADATQLALLADVLLATGVLAGTTEASARAVIRTRPQRRRSNASTPQRDTRRPREPGR